MLRGLKEDIEIAVGIVSRVIHLRKSSGYVFSARFFQEKRKSEQRHVFVTNSKAIS